MSIEENLLKQGRDITRRVVVDYLISEDLDWEKKKYYYGLKQDSVPTIADIVKYKYWNLLKNYNAPIDNQILNLVTDLDMFQYLNERYKFRSEDERFMENLIINDRLDIFRETLLKKSTERKISIAEELRDEIYREDLLGIALLYSSRKISEYLISRLPIERVERKFKEYLYFLSRDLRKLFTYTDDMKLTIDKYRPNFLNEKEDINIPYDQFTSAVEMVKRNDSPANIIDFIGDEGIIRLGRYLVRIKNKYVFRFLDHMNNLVGRGPVSDFIVYVFELTLIREAIFNNDYILGKRLKRSIININKYEKHFNNSLLRDFFDKI